MGHLPRGRKSAGGAREFMMESLSRRRRHLGRCGLYLHYHYGFKLSIPTPGSPGQGPKVRILQRLLLVY